MLALIAGAQYLTGSLLFTIGSILLFLALSVHHHRDKLNVAGIVFYVVGGILFTLASIIEGIMTATSLTWKTAWTLNSLRKITVALSYLGGGLCFMIGSLYFLPALNQPAVGTLVFRAGSCLYIIGSLLSFFQLYKTASDTKQPHEHTLSILLCFLPLRLWSWTLFYYLCGSCSFITGGVLMQYSNIPGWIGLFLWLMGSLFFTMGSYFGLKANLLTNQSTAQKYDDLSIANQLPALP